MRETLKYRLLISNKIIMMWSDIRTQQGFQVYLWPNKQLTNNTTNLEEVENLYQEYTYKEGSRLEQRQLQYFLCHLRYIMPYLFFRTHSFLDVNPHTVYYILIPLLPYNLMWMLVLQKPQANIPHSSLPLLLCPWSILFPFGRKLPAFFLISFLWFCCWSYRI